MGKGRISDINDILLKSYECLTIILPFLFTFWILGLVYKDKKVSQAKGKFLGLFIFILYIIAVFYFTGVGTMFDLQRIKSIYCHFQKTLILSDIF